MTFWTLRQNAPATDGRRCLEVLQEQSFDLIFMDVCMPEMDGFEATRRIRAGECGLPARNTFIAAMTANAMEGDRERCLNAGMDDYLSKPVNKLELLALLERASRYDPGTAGQTVRGLSPANRPAFIQASPAPPPPAWSPVPCHTAC